MINDGKFPRMLYDRHYNDHCDQPTHELERAKKKAACTVLAVDPEDLEKKLAQGYRETHDPSAFEDLPDEEPVIEAPPRKVRKPVSTE